ncbi:hypothetical protein MHI39_20195 [Heyndrickxia sp. FSL K6-6286]|uniref:hypothetical protein n=1 Tax=Heyndrickxia TaxID=2837504 RepID=UPI0015D14B83|nr:hypothetical protein [Heyndrickxia oleronia]MBU5211069.1 hypothetical protein [Heyndrickxia oleronia]NYV68915.1 hypothetical protein [Bacillus sp. Gen3]
MPIIPLKQIITVIRKGEPDRWGNSTEETFVLKCRVDEGSKLVRNTLGQEVVAGMEITLDKLADIRYTDEIEYTDELNRTIKKAPIKIEVIRWISGKPKLTVVYV